MKKIITPILALLLGVNSYSQLTQVGLEVVGEASGDSHGRNVSISSNGTSFVAGARDNDGVATNAGHMRVFQLIGSNWVQKGADIDGELAYDRMGYSTDMSADGSTIVGGSRGAKILGSSYGSAEVYNWNGFGWVQKGLTIYGDSINENFGTKVGLSADGNILAVSAPSSDVNANNEGHVKIYSWDGSNWNQLGSTIRGGQAGFSSGNGMELSDDGTVLSIAAPGDNVTGLGFVRVFKYISGDWFQIGNDFIEGSSANGIGVSMALSYDGLKIAISETGFNSGNGANEGRVKTYEWNGVSWSQYGSDFEGGVGNQFLGRGLSFSDDGNVIVIGSPNIIGQPSIIRVHTWDGSSWNVRDSINSQVDGDGTGISCSLSSSGDTLAFGGLSGLGFVRVYAYSESCAATASSFSITKCNSYMVPSGDETYTSSQTVNDTILNSCGADSVMTINLTINNSSGGIDVQTACGSYAWIDGISYTSSTNIPTFNIVGGSANGCDSLVTLNLTVNTVDVSTAISGATIVANQMGATYKWIDCNNGNSFISGETNASYTAAAIGDYAVIVTMNNCVDTSACVNIISVGVEGNTIANQISIYPNPTRGNVELSLGNLKDVSVKVFSLTGKLVYQVENINASVYQFELNNPTGFYIVNVSSNGKSQQYKLIKE